MKNIALPFILLSLFLMAACSGGSDGPAPPEAPILSFPENNTECLEGTISSANPNLSDVVFRWEPARNAASYRITVKNLISGLILSESTTATSISLSILRGAPFSWSITAVGEDPNNVATSATWKFFNAGDGVVSFAPFPADLIYPASGASLNLGQDQSLELRWASSDIDGDISGYEVYLDTRNPPVTIAGTTSTLGRLTVTGLNAGTVYYWKVITFDRAGNAAQSEVSQFVINP